MISVFLSYARGDDEPFVTRLHADLTARGFDVWFDRRSMPSRNLTFHQEIRDAIAARDRLLLVVGPKAAASDYVRQEWQFAYFEAEKVVTPILRLGDYPLAIDELKLLHAEDFRDDAHYTMHLDQLVRILREPPKPLGKLIAVPSLPPHFLSRTDRLLALRDALRADLDRPVVITGAAACVGMHGTGGIGKSVLAATLSRDRKIREAFPDRYPRLGRPRPAADGRRPATPRPQETSAATARASKPSTKAASKLRWKHPQGQGRPPHPCIDVWRRADVDWFRCDVLGPTLPGDDHHAPTAAGLLTSLGGDASSRSSLLTDAEAALNLLAQAAGGACDKLPSEAADLIAECGRLPLWRWPCAAA